MMRRRVLFLAVFLFSMLMIANRGFAHNRNYVWTEEYKTLPKNAFELENRTTLKVPDAGKSNANTWEYKPELEYGITDHWNVAHYEVWETENRTGVDGGGVKLKDSTTYQGFNFETKYRIGEKGKYWVDALFYLELASKVRPKHRNEVLEGKMVLSKDFGKFNVTYNQIMESEVDRGGRTEHEFTVAAKYEIFSGVTAAVEAKGNYWKPSSHRNEFALGPTLSYENRFFWVTAGVLFGANNHADDEQARLIVGIPF